MVYSFTRPQYGTLTIDLCGSDYDTKIYVMSEDGQIFDCNDDYYNDGTCGSIPRGSTTCGCRPARRTTWSSTVRAAPPATTSSRCAAGTTTRRARRGDGDTIATAIVIPALPYNDTGTTAGYVNDYDEICPYSGSTAPDVVYKYVATSSQSVDIDLCGSGYDTKLYVYDAGLNLIACNDDFYFGAPCGAYVSKLENVPFVAGTTYYIIIDGYGAASGAYVLDDRRLRALRRRLPGRRRRRGRAPAGQRLRRQLQRRLQHVPASRSRRCSWRRRRRADPLRRERLVPECRQPISATPTGTS